MNTQELKKYINRVLGNKIRCLLPSYWWKRLFNQVADRIDDVEQSTSKLIDSKIEEVKMPIVESVDELSKLNLPKGGVAAVEKVGEPVVVNLEDCYLSADAATDWDKYTVIRGFSEKGAPSNAVGQIHLYSDKSMENGLTIACGEGKYFYYKIVNGRRYDSSLEEVNKYLASGEYRLVFGYYIENVSAYVTLYSAFPQPSLYIKGDSWEMLTKENVVNSEDELDGLSVPYGSIAKVNSKKYGKINPFNCYRITSQPSSDTVKRNWDKLKRITQIDVINPDAEPSTMPTIYLHGYANFGGDLIQISYYQGYKVGTGGSSSSSTFMSLAEMNSLLKNSDYRLLMISDTAEHREFFDKYVSLYTPDVIVPDAYIKGETWERLAKESELGGNGGTTIREFYTGDSLTDEQKAWNLETAQAILDKKAIVICNGSILGDAITMNNDGSKEFINSAPTPQGVLYTGVKVEEDGTASVFFRQLYLDDKLSDKSINAVQNKVITAALGNKADKTYVDNAVANVTVDTSGLATKEELNNAIATSITNILNTEV